jgi:hypothetical protein
MMAPDLTEPRRLLARGFHLVKLCRYLKQPEGDNWNDPARRVAAIEDGATGYGVPLATNKLCSIDPDRIDLAPIGLAALGFTLETIMAAGVRTVSTRTNSGGRSAFKDAEGLAWLTFRSPETGTVIEFRARSKNLQDVVPGIVYHTKDGELCSQHYANGKRLDDAPELPTKLLEWWAKCSADMEFYHSQQRKFFAAIGEHLDKPVNAWLALSSGKALAFPAPGYRTPFNEANAVEDILARHGYTQDERSGRWAPATATGKPSVREIPGKNGLWHSDHASDPLQGMFDAWTAHVRLDHGDDVEAAAAAWAAEIARQTEADLDAIHIQAGADEIVQVERDKLDARRREHQKRENARIGAGELTVPPAEVLTVEAAVDRFVFLSDGSRVADVLAPHYDLTFSDFASTFAASKKLVYRPDGKPENVPVAKLWREDRNRKTAVARTFKAGGGLFLNDPEGRPCLNVWKPFDRSLVVVDLEAAGIRLFLDHVAFLFPDPADFGRFLDWLAHVEQCPGVLSHTAWLHIATNFGMGRNWLASVLARVWAGNVASNLDLVQLLGSGFNGQLSRKVLATVDEIHEGGRGTQWEHSERLKQIITAEFRNVNAKYGRQSTEFNACRWLVFSNHVSAIPIQKDDRRFEVVCIDAKPKDAAYYSRLYAALEDPRFIAGVAAYLGRRDISGFNPGAHAVDTDAKKDVAQASQTPMAYWCEILVGHWPRDVIKSGDLYDALEGFEVFKPDRALNPAHRRTLEQYGVTPYKNPVRVGAGNPVRVSILRNRANWANATAAEIKAELTRAVEKFPAWDQLTDVRSALLNKIAPETDENVEGDAF